MQSVSILHCADIHIGARESFLGTLSASRRAETLLTFEKILETVRENGISLLLIAGDLFDSNDIEQNVVDRVFDGLSTLENTEIVFAAGNHDPLRPQSPFCTRKLPENLHVLGTEDCCVTLEKLGTKVYGRSFADVYCAGEQRFGYPVTDDGYINIMVQHGEVKSDLSSDYNSVTKEFIENSGMDYIALGHIHKRSEVGKIGKTSFAYCGCPEGQGFDETGEKGVYVGTVSKGDCSLNFIPVCRRMHLCEKIDISDVAQITDIAPYILKTLEERYGAGFGEHLYKIILTGEIAEETVLPVAEITARVAAGTYYAKVKDSTEVRIDAEALSDEQTLKGIFVKKMLSRIEGADDADKPLLRQALSLGLRAFTSEVSCDED